MIGRQLDYGRQMLARLAPALPDGAPKAVIVPHAGYAYSSTTALAYALLDRGGEGAVGDVLRAVWGSPPS